MTRRFDGRQDHAVAKLEGFWHVDDGSAETPRWTLVTSHAGVCDTAAELRKAVATLIANKKPAEVKEVRLETRNASSARACRCCTWARMTASRSRIEKMRAFAGRKGARSHGSAPRDLPVGSAARAAGAAEDDSP